LFSRALPITAMSAPAEQTALSSEEDLIPPPTIRGIEIEALTAEITASGTRLRAPLPASS